MKSSSSQATVLASAIVSSDVSLRGVNQSSAAEQRREIESDCGREHDDADVLTEISNTLGIDETGDADIAHETDALYSISRFRDPITESLGLLASTWDSIHKSWQATQKRAQYGNPSLQASLLKYAQSLRDLRDNQIGKELQKQLKLHPIWPWLSQFSGVRGVHTARIISMIGDPLRFPGRLCSHGHHLPSDWDSSKTCPMPVLDEKSSSWSECGALIGSIRQGTGVRALWHYAGLHVIDGKMPKNRRGVQSTWQPKIRTALLQPDGIADQIIKHRVEPWRGIYDKTKERLALRGAEMNCEIDKTCGAAKRIENGLPNGSGSTTEIEGISGAIGACESETGLGSEYAHEINSSPGAEEHDGIELGRGSKRSSETTLEIRCTVGSRRRGAAKEGESDNQKGSSSSLSSLSSLRPIQIHKTARIVASKAFLGDLLTEWKKAC